MRYGNGVTNTERADMHSTTTTRLCLGIGSSDHAANASVPPRTGRSTSPGPSAGMETVTRPTVPSRLRSGPADPSNPLSRSLVAFRNTRLVGNPTGGEGQWPAGWQGEGWALRRVVGGALRRGRVGRCARGEGAARKGLRGRGCGGGAARKGLRGRGCAEGAAGGCARTACGEAVRRSAWHQGYGVEVR